jgi:hypothetical protein
VLGEAADNTDSKDPKFCIGIQSGKGWEHSVIIINSHTLSKSIVLIDYYHLSIRCRYCGDPGHCLHDCPLRPGPRRPPWPTGKALRPNASTRAPDHPTATGNPVPTTPKVPESPRHEGKWTISISRGKRTERPAPGDDSKQTLPHVTQLSNSFTILQPPEESLEARVHISKGTGSHCPRSLPRHPSPTSPPFSFPAQFFPPSAA